MQILVKRGLRKNHPGKHQNIMAFGLMLEKSEISSGYKDIFKMYAKLT